MRVNFKNNIMFKGEYYGVTVKDVNASGCGIEYGAKLGEFNKRTDLKQDAEILTDLIEQGVDFNQDLLGGKLENADTFFNGLKKRVGVEFNNPMPGEPIALNIFNFDRGDCIERNIFISSEKFVKKEFQKGMLGLMDITIRFPKKIR